MTKLPLPNFLYIGPDKAGSSWLREALAVYPEVFLTPAKDLYFFDRYYDRGIQWYRSQFREAESGHAVVGEVCPDYLASADAPERIASCLPHVKMMVTLREPSARAFSSYLYMRKHGEGPPTFREALMSCPDLIEHGRYATQLRRYLDCFDRQAIYIALFDDLQADAQAFLDGITDWLGVKRLALHDGVLEARLPASRARITPLAFAVRRSADWVRRHDGAELVGRVKRSPVVQRTLYKPLVGDRPAMSATDRAWVRDRLAPEVDALERDLGIPVRERWGW